MHFKGLDLNLLVFLDALLEERSVSKAALRLNVSQPAVSAALAKLRWHTGDELLQKIGRNVKLTPRAESMIKPLKEILLHIEATVRQSNDLDMALNERNFSISMTTYAAQVILPHFTSKILPLSPKITCDIRDISFDAVTKIKNGELDFCITFMQTKLLNPRETLEETSQELVFSDKWVLVASAENEQVSEGLDHDLFCRQPYVETRPGGISSMAERVMEQMANQPKTILSVPNFELAITSVMNSDSVAIVPSLLVNKIKRPFLKVLPTPFEMPPIEEYLVWHSRNDEDAGFRWFREMMVEIAEEI